MSKFVPPTEPTKKPRPIDHESIWRNLTESLIFACQYGTSEYLRRLDATGRPYNRDRAIQRCRSLADAIVTDYAHIIGFKFTYEGRDMDTANVLRAHAANDDPTFRLRYGHLLPKRPITPSPAERRTGVSDAQRQAEADELAADL